MASVANTLEVRARGRTALIAEIAAVLALFALAIAMLPVTQVLGGGMMVHLLMLARMAAVLGLATWLLHRGGESWRSIGLRRPARWWKLAVLVPVGFALLAGAKALLLPPLLRALGAPAPDLSVFTGLRGNFPEYLFFALPVSFGTAAFVEEMFARGYLLNRLAQILDPARRASWWVAAVGQAVLFGAGHSYQGAGGMIMVTMIGLVLGGIYLLGRRNLWPCILLHGLVDFVGTTAFYAGAVH